jgi:hypothetical protein
LPKGREQPADDGRHFVFDSGRSRSAPSSFLIIDNETEIEGPFLDFRDPWGDPIEIVDYENIQFTKAPNVLRGMGLEHLTKSESARQQLTDKGWAGLILSLQRKLG